MTSREGSPTLRSGTGSVKRDLNIKSIWLDNSFGERDRIVRYRVNAKLSFLVEGGQ